MKQKHAKRLFTLMMSVMVFMMFTIAATVEVNAASGTKSFWVTSSEKEVYTYSSTYSDGTTNSSTNTYNYSFTYKNGLETAFKSDTGKTTYKHNKKGYVISYKSYDSKGKLFRSGVYKRKSNGDASKLTVYEYTNGKKKLNSTATYTYWKKGVVKKQTVVNSDGSKDVYKYNKKGDMTSSSMENGKYVTKYTRTYKNGRVSKSVATYSGTGYRYADSETTTYKYTVKNKKVTKIVAQTTTKLSDGTTEKSTSSTSYTYKNGRNTKIVSESKSSGSWGKRNSKSVITLNYKKISVPKKFWKFYQ